MISLSAFTESVGAQSTTRTSERLPTLARVWAQAKYFHPALAGARTVDWDSALVGTIPAVRSARTDQELAAAVQAMLAPLGDPLTRVECADTATADTTQEKQLAWRRTADGIVVVMAGSYYDLFSAPAQQALAELTAALPAAKAVVFDLRSRRPTDTYGRVQLAGTFATLERLLVTDTLETPGERRRVYAG